MRGFLVYLLPHLLQAEEALLSALLIQRLSQLVIARNEAIP